MNSDLPATGTAALLELLDPFVPDDFINESWPHGHTGGRRCEHTPAHLYSVPLLCLVLAVHSLNLLIQMMPEQRAWRKFPGPRRQSRVPDVRMMHQFRCRVGVAGLRRINQPLLAPLLAPYAWQPWSVGLIDATDLPAACVGFKKKHRAVLRRARCVERAHAQDGAEPMFRRLQETHATPVAAPLPSRGAVGAAGQLGRARQCFRGRAAGSQPVLLSAAMGLVSAAGRGGHGVFGGGGQTTRPGAVARGGPHQAAERHEAGAALCGVGSGRLPAGRTADVAGLRWPGWGTLVWRRRGTGTMPLLLGSRTLPAAICPSARGTRDLAGPAAAGQPTGATSVAAGASVD